MREILGCVIVALLLTSAVGCSRSGPSPTGGEQPDPVTVSTAADGKRPKFESELVYTHTINGGTGSSNHTSTRYDDGKPFRAVENWSTSIKGGPVTLDCEVAFVTHRDGKDVYKIKYTVGKAGGSETRTTEAGYDGKRTVLSEDQHGTLVLQPPAK